MSTQQTHGATPPTAARLREMAAAYRRSAETSRYHEKNCRADMFLSAAESHRIDAERDEVCAAALLAGAEAIEQCGELREIVRDFQRMYCGFGMKTEAESLNDRASAARARLEAL